MIDKLEQVDKWVRENVTYVRDKKGFDDWKTPIRTLSERKGDCEDFAILAAYKLEQLGVNEDIMYLSTCHTKGLKGANHGFLLVETNNGLYTCADTYDKFKQPSYVFDVYRKEDMRKWMRISDPHNWREW